MEHPQKTVTSNFDSPYQGYIVVAPLSRATTAKIHHIQDELAAQLPEGCLWLPRDEQLHMTLLHIVTNGDTPNDANNPALFARIKDDVMRALGAAIPPKLDIELSLERLRADPGALIAKWQDDGTYDEIRRKFMERFELPEGTRQPPVIIHTTIARFRQEIDYNDAQKAVASLDIPKITEHTMAFQLVHEQKLFMQKHEVLATFPAKTA